MKGIEYLILNRLVENNPTAVAQFLKTTPNLDKVKSDSNFFQTSETKLSY